MCDRCEELEEEVRQLKEQLQGVKTFPREMRLTRREAQVLRQLVTRGRATKASLSAAIYGHLNSPPDDQIFPVLIYRVRQKIKPLRIGSVWGEGWTLEGEDRAALQALMVME